MPAACVATISVGITLERNGTTVAVHCFESVCFTYLRLILGSSLGVDFSRRWHQFGAKATGRILVALQDACQIRDVRGGQTQRFDLCYEQT